MPDEPQRPGPPRPGPSHDGPNGDELSEKPLVHTRDVIDEALARQAARRKPSGPPREMPVTPTLPKQPRPARERKRRRRS